MLRDEPQARQLFVREGYDSIEFWLLTDPIDIEAEDRFYAAAADLIRENPRSSIQFHLASPRLFSQDIDMLGDMIPRDADTISLRD